MFLMCFYLLLFRFLKTRLNTIWHCLNLSSVNVCRAMFELEGGDISWTVDEGEEVPFFSCETYKVGL